MITRVDVDRIIGGLPSALSSIGTAIAGQTGREFAAADSVPKVRFPVHESLMTREAYDHFRSTDWLLNAGPDSYWGPGMQLAVLRRKVFVEPAPEFCFHATEAANHEEIVARGILPGNRVGKSARLRMFCDSVHYILAALTAEDAAGWVQRLADRGDFRVYKVRVQGFGLVADPCAGVVAGRPDGYILDTDHVPASLVGDSILLERA